MLRRVANGAIAFEFVGRFETADPAVRISQLYLNYPHTKAKTGSGGSFSAYAVLTFESVWTDGRQGVVATKGEVFQTRLNLGQRSLEPNKTEDSAAADPRYSSWFPSIPKSVLVTEADISRDLKGVPTVNGIAAHDVVSIVPSPSNPSRGQLTYRVGEGPFTMTATVFETADAADLVGEFAGAYKDNKAKLRDAILKAID